MSFFDIFKKNRSKIPRTVFDSIPYHQVYENGVIETEPGTFTKAYRLEDLNFRAATEEQQLEIFHSYGRFLNSFSTNVEFQIYIQNKPTDRKKFLETVRFEPRNDGLNKYRQEMNHILLDRVAKGKNNLMQEKICIVSLYDNDTAQAMNTLESIDHEVEMALKKVVPGSRPKPMTLEERLRVLFDIYNQDGYGCFENATDENGRTYFDIKKMITSKDAIAPSGMSFKGNHFTLGETFGRALFLQGVPAWLSTEFIADLADLPYSMMISVHYRPIEQGKAIRKVRDHIMSLNARISATQKKASEEGYSTQVISPELYHSQEQANTLLEDMISRDQKIYYTTFTVVVYGQSLEAVSDAVRMVSSISGKYNAPIRPLLYQQEPGLNSSLPLCINKLHVDRMQTTECASIFIPYSSQEMFQKNGICYGQNQISKTPFMYNRLNGKNYNGLIFGESGTGKSMAAKLEMFNYQLRSDKYQVYIIDPENEYSPMVRNFNGEVIDLSTISKRFVNPLDMDINYAGDSDSLSMKSDYIISMLEIMYGRNRTITAKEKSIIDRCVKIIYAGYLQHIKERNQSGDPITCDKDSAPTLMNLYRALKEQPEQEAGDLADVLEIYATGSLSTFAHRSNVETDARIVSYNIKDLGAGMKDLGLFVCLNDVWNKMIENSAKGIWTFFYIDEFYLLLRSKSASSFLMEIWKRARKWRGVPTGIMQNAEDLTNSQESRAIINNSSFVMMMSLSRDDRIILGDALNIPDSLLEYVKNGDPGTGLIYTGKTCLPFDNTIPEDSMIYRMLTTKPMQE